MTGIHQSVRGSHARAVTRPVWGTSTPNSVALSAEFAGEPSGAGGSRPHRPDRVILCDLIKGADKSDPNPNHPAHPGGADRLGRRSGRRHR